MRESCVKHGENEGGKSEHWGTKQIFGLGGPGLNGEEGSPHPPILANHVFNPPS